MWNISDKLRKSLKAFRQAEAESYARRFQARPSIRRLEQRRVLNAEFALDGSTLTLENFQNNVNDLTIANDGSGDYTFKLSDGVWSEAAGSDANSFTGEGTDTLTVDPDDVLAMLVNDAGSAVDFGVLLDDPNFAGETLELQGVGPVSQTGLAPMSFDTLTLDADGGDLELSSLTLVGDLTVENVMNLTDATDARIQVTGDARFSAIDEIALANENSAANELIVGGTARFESGNGDISVGVEDGAADPSQGALANVQIGSIELVTGGSFTVVSDNDLTEVTVDVDPSGGADEYHLNVSGDPNFVFDVSDSGDDLLVNEVDASINLSITTRSGDLQLGEVTVGNELTLVSLDGSILELANDEAAPVQDLSAVRIHLVAKNHISGAGLGGSADGKIELSPDAIVTASSTELGNLGLRGLGALTLADLETADGSIHVTAAGEILVNDLGVRASDFAKLASDDVIALQASVGGAQVGLVARTAITQNANGIVTTPELLVMADDTALLDVADNAVEKVAANVGTAFNSGTSVLRLHSVVTTTVESVTVDGMTIIGISADSDANDGTSTLIGEVKLTVEGTDQDLLIENAIQANRVGLVSGRSIAQTAQGVLTTGTDFFSDGLLVMANTDVLLDQADNVVAEVVADVNGAFRFRSATNLVVGDVTVDGMQVVGISADANANLGPANRSAEVKLISADAITLNQAIEADEVFLMTGTSVDQVNPGIVIASTLLLDAGDSITLELANQVEDIAARSTAGNVLVNSISDLNVVSDTIDGMTVDGITASGFAKIITAGSLDVQASVTAGQVGLVAGVAANHDITQTAAGVVITPELLVMTSGDVILQQDNHVEEIAADVDGSLYFRTITDLVVGQVTIVTGPAVIDRMSVTGVSSDGDTTDGFVTPVLTPPTDREVKLEVNGPAGNRTLRLEQAVEGERVFLEADKTIDQDAGILVHAAELLLMAGGDVTLPEANRVPLVAANITDGSLVFTADLALTISTLSFNGPNPSASQETIAGITILDQGIFDGLNFDLTARGTLDQEIIADPAMRAKVDVDVVQAKFTVPAGASILLADIGTSTAELDTTGHRATTDNRFFNDNSGFESQLVFETSTLGRIRDLTLFDETAVVFEDTDAVPDGMAINITGDLIVIGGRSPDTVNQPNGLAIGSTATMIVAGEAQFHAFNGLGGNDELSVDLPDLAIDTSASGAGNVAVTTDDGNALLTNTVEVNFRETIRSIVEGDLTVTAEANDISDEAEAQVIVSGDARFVAEAGDIVLADHHGPVSGTNNRLTVGGKVTFVAGTEGNVDVGIQVATGMFADAVVEFGSVSFNTDSDNQTANSGRVRIAEDSDMRVALADFDGNGFADNANEAGAVMLSTTMLGQSITLESITAQSLIVDSRDAVRDVAGNTGNRTEILVTDFVEIRASDEIRLAVGAINQTRFTVGNNARFVADDHITVGVISRGRDAGAIVELGSVSFEGRRSVSISEDNAMLVVGDNSAQTLLLRSSESIADASATTMQVSGEAEFRAVGDIILADEDSAMNQLIVGQTVLFQSTGQGIVDVGVQTNGSDAAAVVELGSLSFNTDNNDLTDDSGRVRIAEDSDLRVVEDRFMLAGSNFQDNEGGIVNLRTTVPGASIELHSMIVESLTVDSQGTVSDTTNSTGRSADIRVTQDALFSADREITLAETEFPGNRLEVGGNAKFVSSEGRNIDVGVTPVGINAGAETAFGTLTFESGDGVTSGGRVRIAEDDGLPTGNDGMLITSANTAGTLELQSAQAIADEAATTVRVVNDASFIAGAAIGLNENALDELIVGSHAAFEGSSITISNSGQFEAGTLQVRAAGDVTIEEDDSTVFARTSQAGFLHLSSRGSITDDSSAALTVDSLATFIPITPASIFLGDQGARLDLNRLEIPSLTTNVSLVEQNGLTLQEVLVDANLYVTSETGDILQDIRQPGDTTPIAASSLLTATQAAFDAKQGAVILRNTSFVALALQAGGTHDLATVGLPDIAEVLVALDATTIGRPAAGDPETALQPAEQKATGEIGDREVGSQYALFVGNNELDLNLGDRLFDPATSSVQSLQGVQTLAGNAYLGGSKDIFFSAAGANSQDIAVMVHSDFVFTAVASEDLTIDPGTKLVSVDAAGSEVGVVKDVHTPFQTFDGRLEGDEEKAGPRFVITAPESGFGAPTSKEVGRNPDGRIVQRVQIDVGTAGEKGLFGDVLWADEVNGFVPEPGPRNRIDLDIVGERENLFLASLEKDAAGNPVLDDSGNFIVRDLEATEFTSTENADFEHVFQESFFVGEAANPNFPRLPTEIRLFNASSINLFERGGERNLNRSISTEDESEPVDSNGDGIPDTAVRPARDDNFVSPVQRIIGVPPDFQQVFIPLTPPIYTPVIIVSEDRPFALEKTDFDPPRVVDPQEGLVKYGYLGEDEELDEIDSETWPDGVTESFIQDIKATVRDGNLIDFPLGDYVIKVQRTEGGEVEEIRFKKTADQSGDGQPDIEDQVPVQGFDLNSSTMRPGANPNEAQVSNPANDTEDSWTDAWRLWGADRPNADSVGSTIQTDRKTVDRQAANESTSRERHRRAIQQLENRHTMNEQQSVSQDLPLEADAADSTIASLVAGSLVMAKYQGSERGKQWREAWTRQVFKSWRR